MKPPETHPCDGKHEHFAYRPGYFGDRKGGLATLPLRLLNAFPMGLLQTEPFNYKETEAGVGFDLAFLEEPDVAAHARPAACTNSCRSGACRGRL
jgi:hypothetical protein